jgi:cell wall-associated NlpC family hydrolase
MRENYDYLQSIMPTFTQLMVLVAIAGYSWGVSADPLDDFISNLTPTDPTPLALKPIAKLQEAAIAAISFVGKPYAYGSSNPDVGFDCSGLVQYVLLQSGVKKLPRSSLEMYENSSPIEVDNLVVGDLLFFRTSNSQINHVGIYVGEGRFIHAPSSGNFVRLDKLEQSYWQKAFAGGRRVLSLE